MSHSSINHISMWLAVHCIGISPRVAYFEDRLGIVEASAGNIMPCGESRLARRLLKPKHSSGLVDSLSESHRLRDRFFVHVNCGYSLSETSVKEICLWAFGQNLQMAFASEPIHCEFCRCSFRILSAEKNTSVEELKRASIEPANRWVKGSVHVS